MYIRVLWKKKYIRLFVSSTAPGISIIYCHNYREWYRKFYPKKIVIGSVFTKYIIRTANNSGVGGTAGLIKSSLRSYYIYLYYVQCGSVIQIIYYTRTIYTHMWMTETTF